MSFFPTDTNLLENTSQDKMDAVWSNCFFSQKITPRCSHTATVLKSEATLTEGQEIYLIGGAQFLNSTQCFEHYGDIWKISPKNLEVLKIEPIGGDIIPRRGHSATSFQNRWIILFGGFVQIHEREDPVLSNDLQIFDSHLLTWISIQQCGEIPYPRRGHISAICPHTNRLILFGGDTERLTNLRSISELDLTPLLHFDSTFPPLQLKWQTVQYSGDLIPPLLSLTAFCSTDSNGILISGGTALDLSTMNIGFSEKLFYFDLLTYTFHDLYSYCRPSNTAVMSCMNEGRFCSSMSQIDQKNFLIYGGTTKDHLYPSTIISLSFSHPLPLDRTGLADLDIIWDILPLHSETSISPSPRNGMILIPNLSSSLLFPNFHFEPASLSITPQLTTLSFLMFGGGCYQKEYFDDWHALDLSLSPKFLVERYFGGTDRPDDTDHDRNRLLIEEAMADSVMSANSFPHLLLFPLPSFPDLLISLSLPHDEAVDVCERNTRVAIPVHREVLLASCHFFHSLLSYQWSDLREPPSAPSSSSSSSSSTPSDLPVVNLADVSLDMMIILLLEIYSHHVNSSQENEGALVPMVKDYLNSHSLTSEDDGISLRYLKLAQLIHTCNRFQLIPLQIKAERHLLSLLAASFHSNLVLDNLTFLLQLLVLVSDSYTYQIPSVLKYYSKISSQICLQRIREAPGEVTSRTSSGEEDQKVEQEQQRKWEGEVLELCSSIKIYLMDGMNQLSTDLCFEMLEHIEEMIDALGRREGVRSHLVGQALFVKTGEEAR
jgi:hypothetical protein